MWDLAEEYGLADDYFSGMLFVLAPDPLVASSPGGNGPAVTQRFGLGDSRAATRRAGVRPSYLQQAQNDTAVEDLLNSTSTSWDYYEFSARSWANRLEREPHRWAGDGWRVQLLESRGGEERVVRTRS